MSSNDFQPLSDDYPRLQMECEQCRGTGKDRVGGRCDYCAGFGYYYYAKARAEIPTTSLD